MFVLNFISLFSLIAYIVRLTLAEDGTTINNGNRK